jgi:hypothetical protein
MLAWASCWESKDCFSAAVPAAGVFKFEFFASLAPCVAPNLVCVRILFNKCSTFCPHCFKNDRSVALELPIHSCVSYYHSVCALNAYIGPARDSSACVLTACYRPVRWCLSATVVRVGLTQSNPPTTRI